MFKKNLILKQPNLFTIIGFFYSSEWKLYELSFMDGVLKFVILVVSFLKVSKTGQVPNKYRG